MKTWHRSVAPPCDDDDNQFVRKMASLEELAPLSGAHHVRMMITRFVRKMAPPCDDDNQFCPEDGAT